MQAQTRDGRLTAGLAGQAELKKILESLGFTVIETGQESWLPTLVHEVLRRNHTDPMVRAVRYQPDLLAYSPRFPLAWWDAKVNTRPGTPNFSLEEACYTEQIARTRKGERVAIAFKDTDGRWSAQWVDLLRVNADRSGDRHDAKGSQTPYYLVAKDSTEPLGGFVAFRSRGY